MKIYIKETLFCYRYEVRKGQTLKANMSASNTRLYIGNIPKPKDHDEILEEFSKHLEGIEEVIISTNDEMLEKDLKNKGYCFMEFGDHKSAATAKKKLENTREHVSRSLFVCLY